MGRALAVSWWETLTMKVRKVRPSLDQRTTSHSVNAGGRSRYARMKGDLALCQTVYRPSRILNYWQAVASRYRGRQSSYLVYKIATFVSPVTDGYPYVSRRPSVRLKTVPPLARKVEAGSGIAGALQKQTARLEVAVEAHERTLLVGRVFCTDRHIVTPSIITSL